MMLIDVLLVVAIVYFLFLPITDRRTVHMKLAVVCTLLALLAVTRTHAPQVQLAGVVQSR